EPNRGEGNATLVSERTRPGYRDRDAPQAHRGQLREAVLVGRRSRSNIGLDPLRPRVLPVFRDTLIAALAQRSFHGACGESALGEQRGAAVLVSGGGIIESAAEKIEQRRADERQDDERDEDFEQRGAGR